MESKKLKPAKQALADAIHQNGGWREKANYAVQSGGNLRIHFTDDDKKPVRCEDGGWRCQYGFMFFGSTSPLKSKLPNWHQCILSRDEYFAAYPRQVKVEVNNETERKAEAEMKSESEMTIKESDWHKNGELPPVGEVVEFVRTYDVDWHKQLNTGTNVTVLAHYSPCDDGEMVAVFCYEVCDDTEKGRLVDQGISVCFRPLRTEREKAIDEMAQDISGGETPKIYMVQCATKLYDSGYRKEVK